MVNLLKMSNVSSIESKSPRPIPPKRSSADFDESDPSSSQPGTTKRLRIETEEAEQEAKTVQQQPKPLPLKRPHASLLEDLVNPSPAPKRYLPESVDSFVTQWVESASGSESYRGRHCRSDTLLSYLDGDIIPRRLTKSAPNMEYKRDADGFVLPPTPASTRSHSYRANAEDDPRVSSYAKSITPSDISGAFTGSGRRSLVEDPYYRDMNLASNNIYIRDFYEEFPEDIAGLVNHVRKDRDSPGLSSDQLKQNTRLYDLEMGTAEPAVENYFKANIFPEPGRSDSLKRIDKNPIAKQVVPSVGSNLKVSTPVPDMLYGYNRLGAFPQQQTQLISMGTEIIANSQGLIFPFFVIEFKADGPGGSGSMWVATNQCLGGSASCVNIAERLNRQLRQCKNKEVRPINSAAFSIAMNGTEARLYVSWKHDELKYYMQKIDSFLLQKPKDYVEFRRYVRNIIDWGKDKRLKEIRDSLDNLLEENRKIASQQAKSRPPPSSNDSASSSSQKRKSSSSRGRNSNAKAVQEYPNGGANISPSAYFHKYNQDDANDIYGPPPARFQENDRYNSSMQIPAADNVYAPPSASFQEYNPEQIPATDYVYVPPSASSQKYNHK
ncbi:hypothetical protein B7494_g6176 [Chlorociboria aeruginascens]|nr:hypothetical protein B7494_g6176 [Chlorociboria aeruginascens]